MPSSSRFVKVKDITFSQPVSRDKPPQAQPHYFFGTKVLEPYVNYAWLYGYIKPVKLLIIY